MRIGIVGARLAGSYAALILARLGHEIILLDPSTDGEKACGGGITAKAHLTMRWLREANLPHSEIRTVELMTVEGRGTALRLSHPIQVFSRAALDSALRREAVLAGARFIPERAHQFNANGRGWAFSTASGESYEVDFLVGADGAASSVRSSVAAKLGAEDLSLALGYYLPGVHHPDKVVIVFQEHGFQGYLWSFPRVDHASVGIIHHLNGVQATDLKQRVNSFITERYPGTNTSEMEFYAARVPCLRPRTLVTQQICGPNWALLGDAAGFADPITAEGIYFALRSAEIFGEAVRAGEPMSYEQRWRLDFGADLVLAAGWCDRFYSGTFLRGAFTRRALQMVERSATARWITDSLISGHQRYVQLRKCLLSRSPRIFVEALRTALLPRSS